MELLTELGERVRGARVRRGWSQAELAQRSGLSVRFVAELEHGRGNISVLRLAEVAGALGVPMAELFAAKREHVALVGLRGAGKTTIGRRLAPELGMTFVEVDTAVEERAGLRLGEIFDYHGGAHYRALMREMLDELLQSTEPKVLACGGSVVADADTWRSVRSRARTVWLQAPAAVHLARVEAQGDFRPMRGRADALAELRQVLAAREPEYGLAELRVETEREGVEGAVATIVGWVRGGDPAVR